MQAVNSCYRVCGCSSSTNRSRNGIKILLPRRQVRCYPSVIDLTGVDVMSKLCGRAKDPGFPLNI